MGGRVTLVVAIVASLVAGVALVPFWVGGRVASAYAAWVERADGAAPGLRVDGALERGLWHSTAQTTVRVDEGERTRTFVVDHWIAHGPVPLAEVLRGRSPFVLAAAVVETRLGADAATLPRIAAALDGQPILRIVAWLGLDESVRVEAVAPAFRLEDGSAHTAGARASLTVGPGGTGPADARIELGASVLRDGDTRLSLGGGQGMLHLDDPGRRESFSLDVDLAPSSVAGPGGSIGVGRVRAQLASVATGADEATRRLSLEVDEVTLRGADPSADAVHLADLGIAQSGGPDPDTGLHVYETEIRFATLEAGQDVYGPGVAAVSIRRIDASAFRDVRAALAAPPSGAAGEDAGRETAALAASALARLLAARPEIEIESVSVGTPAGAIEGRGRLVLSDRAASSAPPSGQGAPWLDGLSGSADVSVPAPWLAAALDAQLAEQVRAEMADATDAELAEAAAFVREAVLARLVAQGWLVPDGGRYRARLGLEDGVVTVNGRPLDPAALGGANAIP